MSLEEPKTALLALRMENIFSFKEGVDVSFELPKKASEQINNNLPFTTALCIKGANASGKTNILKGLSFVQTFIRSSFDYEVDKDITIDSFAGNDQEPSVFQVDFTVDKLFYRYTLEIVNKKVYKEILERKKKRMSPVLVRENDNIIKVIPELKEIKKIKLRSNVSLFSSAKQSDIEFDKNITNFFYNFFSNVNETGFDDFKQQIYLVSKILYSDPKALNFVKKLLTSIDLGLDDIKIKKTINDKGEEIFFPFFVHNIGDYKHYLSHYDESAGTKCLYSNLLLYFLTLKSGGVLIFDEFEMNLHPHILPKLIELFLNPETNPKNGQIIFTTHDTAIMDYVTKYRQLLVTKEENESFAYRLDDIKEIRNDRKISPLYNSGELKGVPKL